MKRAAIGPGLALALLAAACGQSDEPAPEASDAPALGAGRVPLQADEFPALASKDCAVVVEFYLESLGGREWAQAALVWNDPAIDAARLEALFGGYREFQLAWTEPFVEGAAGSSFCTVTGKLTDAQDADKPGREGTLVLKRVNDVPGATPEQLRWTLQSSTFVENLARAGRAEP